MGSKKRARLAVLVAALAASHQVHISSPSSSGGCCMVAVMALSSTVSTAGRRGRAIAAAGGGGGRREYRSSTSTTTTTTTRTPHHHRNDKHHHNHNGSRPQRGPPEFLQFNQKLKQLISNNNQKEAEDLLLTSLQRYEEGRGTLRPDKFHFGIVINGWARSKEDGSTERAEGLLRRIEQYYYAEGKTWLKPVVVQYSSVINALARSKPQRGAAGDKNAQKAEDMLRHMERMYEAGNVDVKPDKITYSSVIHAWAKSARQNQNVNAALRAEAVLRRMEQLYHNNDDDHVDVDVKPDVIAYTTVITAWSNCNRAAKAEAMLEAMEKRYKETGDVDVRPNVATYTAVIDAWAKSKSKSNEHNNHQNSNADANDANDASNTSCTISISISKAEEVFQRMQERGIRPDIASYTAVLHGLARTSIHDHDADRGATTKATEKETATETCTLRAEAILQQMEDQFMLSSNSNNKHFQNAASGAYNAMMDMWAKHGDAQRAGQVFQRMQQMKVRPNALSYSSLINTYAKSKQPRAAFQAEAILKQLMENDSDNDNDNTSLLATQTFDAMIDAWARSNVYVKDSAERAEALFFEMLERYECHRSADANANRNRNHAIRPSVRSCNKVLLAWSRSSHVDAPLRAEAFLNKLEHECGHIVNPDVVSYTTVMKAWASSSDPQAGSKADALLTSAIEKYRAGDASMKPDVVTYNCFLKALANCCSINHSRDDYDVEGACRQADEILVGMILLSRIGDVQVRPDRITYEHMIEVWSKSDSVKAVGKIESYRQMALATGQSNGGDGSVEEL